MPLGDHLCADEDVDFPRIHISVHGGERVSPPGGVPVETGYLGIREQLSDLFLQFLGAITTETNHCSMAFHAVAGNSRREITIMAKQAVFLAVKGEGDTAMGTF